MLRASLSRGGKRREDMCSVIDHKREVPFSWKQFAVRSGEARGHSAAMARRHEPISPSVPQVNIHGDLLQAKPPWSDQNQQLIRLASRTLAQRLGQRARDSTLDLGSSQHIAISSIQTAGEYTQNEAWEPSQDDRRPQCAP